MPFHVGQRVVCVDATRIKNDAAPLNKGAIYTVRELECDEDEGYGLRLCEIVNRNHPTIGTEISYYSRRFRPIVNRKTDISIFTKMLVPQKQGEPA